MRALAFNERAPYNDGGRQVLAQLDERLDAVVSRIHNSRVWLTLCASETSTQLARAVMREIMFEIYSYQPLTLQAGFSMLGRLPKHETKLLNSLVHHKAEEAGHSEWARRDFLLLGGEAGKLSTPPSPAAFAVAAVWDRLAAHENPMGYLGAEYLFECLTMRLAPEMVAVLQSKRFPLQEAAFVVDHATEDVKHTNLLVHWILDVASRYPEASDSMLRCFDYFGEVYPSPVWTAALERALSSEGMA